MNNDNNKMNQIKISNHLYKLQQTAKISKCIMNNYIYSK